MQAERPTVYLPGHDFASATRLAAHQIASTTPARGDAMSAFDTGVRIERPIDDVFTYVSSRRARNGREPRGAQDHPRAVAVAPDHVVRLR